MPIDLTDMPRLTPSRRKALEFAGKMAELDEMIAYTLVGRAAVVKSNYNGQHFGSSKPSWKGRTVHIAHAFYSGTANKPHITVWLKEERAGGGSAALGLDELEIVED